MSALVPWHFAVPRPAVRWTGVAALLCLVTACAAEDEDAPVDVKGKGKSGAAGAKAGGAGGKSTGKGGSAGDESAGAGGAEEGEGGTGGTGGKAGAAAGGKAGAAAGGKAGAAAGGKAGASAGGKAGAAAGGKAGTSAGGKAGEGGSNEEAGAGGSNEEGGAGGSTEEGGAGGSNEGGAGGAGGTITQGGAAGAGGTGTPTTCPVTIEPLLTYTLVNGAFPGTGHPDAAVHVPPGFDACRSPGLIVFFHGFNNCVVNAIGSANTPCTPGGGARTALQLAEQLDASGANALLVVVETAFDQATGKPGALVETGRLKALLNEILAGNLATKLGQPLDVDAFDRVVLASHSGGYWALAESYANGGLTNVREIDLYDSLYGEYATYKGFLDDNAASFVSTAKPPFRFACVWTSGGGTVDDSEDLQKDAAAALAGAGLSSSMLFDQTSGTFTDEDYLHPVIFKRSALSHDGVPQYYFERLAKVGFVQR